MLDYDEIKSVIKRLESGDTNWDAVQKLAYLYSVRDHGLTQDHYMAEPKSERTDTPIEYSQTIEAVSDSEFMQAIDGMKLEIFLPIVDELMNTILITNPRLYDSVMRRVTE